MQTLRTISIGREAARLQAARYKRPSRGIINHVAVFVESLDAESFVDALRSIGDGDEWSPCVVRQMCIRAANDIEIFEEHFDE